MTARGAVIDRNRLRWFHRCRVCGYGWPSRYEHPDCCANPRCRSTRWNAKPVERNPVKCPHCGHLWLPRRLVPGRCPRCYKLVSADLAHPYAGLRAYRRARRQARKHDPRPRPEEVRYREEQEGNRK